MEYFCHQCFAEFTEENPEKCPECDSEFIEMALHSEDEPIEVNEPAFPFVQMRNPSQTNALLLSLFNQMFRHNFEAESLSQAPSADEDEFYDDYERGQRVYRGEHEDDVYRNDPQVRLNTPIPAIQIHNINKIMGNPEDYVFSEGGMDEIISRLMDEEALKNMPPPASKQVIDSLPDFRAKTVEECPICQENFVVHEVVKKLPCDHLFHKDCISSWLKVNGTCPICRLPLHE